VRTPVIVMTGASSGVGRATALRLADRKPVRLVLAARSVESLEAVAAECRSLGATAIALPTDAQGERPRSRIVIVGSLFSKIVAPAVGACAASKHATLALSETLRLELLGSGIRADVACPASRGAGRQDAGQLGPPARRSFDGLRPPGPFCDPAHRPARQTIPEEKRHVAPPRADVECRLRRLSATWGASSARSMSSSESQVAQSG